MELNKTKDFYEEVKTMGFFKRIFGWSKVIPLLTESYAELKQI